MVNAKENQNRRLIEGNVFIYRSIDVLYIAALMLGLTIDYILTCQKRERPVRSEIKFLSGKNFARILFKEQEDISESLHYRGLLIDYAYDLMSSDKSDYRVIYLQIGREIVGMVEKITYEEE